MSRLTDKTYWDDGYKKRKDLQPIAVCGYRNFCNRKMLDIKEKIGLECSSVLELGGGASGWLVMLATRYPNSKFTALDYSLKGCGLLKDYARQNGLGNVRVHCGDFFDDALTIGEFDLVYSHGVVEHFEDLGGVLAAFRKYLRKEGVLVTIIPNMAGILGSLTRFFNRRIYDLHVPHDRESLVRGHLDAGLTVKESGYICSNNFGVMASCFDKETGWKWNVYKQLTRVSKLVWAFESRVFELPTSKLFSPYIYVIAKSK